ncbi:MAG: hypothetical protein AABW89_05180 [Nanoarchaeota archaeon]
MVKKEDGKIILPAISVEKQLVEEMRKYSKKKGYPMSLVRRRAYALWVNKQRKADGQEEKQWIEV